MYALSSLSAQRFDGIRHHNKIWITDRHDDNVWLMKSKVKLCQLIEILSLLLARSETLFIIDDVISERNLDKRR